MDQALAWLVQQLQAKGSDYDTFVCNLQKS